ncbi:hypothetical protein HDU96_000457 [Phlyctochytrium bullatum]|nr:hypothetical protein HDU96_000457 [Phlyctochytrium bullatum]
MADEHNSRESETSRQSMSPTSAQSDPPLPSSTGPAPRPRSPAGGSPHEPSPSTDSKTWDVIRNELKRRSEYGRLADLIRSPSPTFEPPPQTRSLFESSPGHSSGTDRFGHGRKHKHSKRLSMMIDLGNADAARKHLLHCKKGHIQASVRLEAVMKFSPWAAGRKTMNRAMELRQKHEIALDRARDAYLEETKGANLIHIETPNLPPLALFLFFVAWFFPTRHNGSVVTFREKFPNYANPECVGILFNALEAFSKRIPSECLDDFKKGQAEFLKNARNVDALEDAFSEVIHADPDHLTLSIAYHESEQHLRKRQIERKARLTNERDAMERGLFERWLDNADNAHSQELGEIENEIQSFLDNPRQATTQQRTGRPGVASSASSASSAKGAAKRSSAAAPDDNDEDDEDDEAGPLDVRHTAVGNASSAKRTGRPGAASSASSAKGAAKRSSAAAAEDDDAGPLDVSKRRRQSASVREPAFSPPVAVREGSNTIAGMYVYDDDDGETKEYLWPVEPRDSAAHADGSMSPRAFKWSGTCTEMNAFTITKVVSVRPELLLTDMVGWVESSTFKLAPLAEAVKKVTGGALDPVKAAAERILAKYQHGSAPWKQIQGRVKKHLDGSLVMARSLPQLPEAPRSSPKLPADPRSSPQLPADPRGPPRTPAPVLLHVSPVVPPVEELLLVA